MSNPLEFTPWIPSLVKYPPQPTPIRPIAVIVHFTGGGTLSAQVTSREVGFSGVGTLSAEIQIGRANYAAFSSEGSFSATTPRADIDMELRGTGTLSATVTGS
jgi:hypothetical protein